MPITWPSGGSLFVVWADDNCNLGTDVGNQIDNFSLRVTAGLPPNFSCSVFSPANNALLLSGSPITATAGAASGNAPYVIQYFLSSGANNPVFAAAGSSTTEPYSVSLGHLAAGSYRIYAVATDQNGAGAITTSQTNSFSVADPLVVTIAAPVNNASFDHLTSIIGTATVAGGIAPYSVQFYLDEAANGSPITAGPYTRDFGQLFVGGHTIRAEVRDASGWVSNSVPATIFVTGPLAVALSPTNGASFNYGEAITLTAVAGGGTAPYSLSFYTNDQLASTLTAEPFTVQAGMLPVGTHSIFVSATDSSPTTQQANSGTNIITILENPLTVSLTSPTNGQSAAVGNPFVLRAVAAVAAPVMVTSVEFFVDGFSAGTDTTAPYSVAANIGLDGHFAYAATTDSLGRVRYSQTNQVVGIVDPLANDNFANRFELGTPASVTGSNVGATTEPGEPTSSGFFTRWGATLWWRWTAPISGPVRIDTLGSSFNTGLGVWTGSAVNAPLVSVAMNDNAPGTQASLVTFNAQQGVEYQIQVGGMQPGFGGGTPATGSIQLHLTMPPAVNLVSPIGGSVVLTGTPIPVEATATAAIGSITQVDLYRGNTLLGSLSTVPYSVLDTNAPAGTNSFYAVATDTLGQVTTSATRNVFVANLGVTITAPVDGSVYLNGSPVTVQVFPMLSSGSITNVEFYVDGIKFGEDGVAPFSLASANFTGGSHRLTAVGRSDEGGVYNSQAVYIGIADTFIAAGSEWKYLDDGSNQGTNWVASDFDDADWNTGEAELGYGDGDETTEVQDNATAGYNAADVDRYITTYFRKEFVVSRATSFDALFVSLERDDGAVIYLNGKEVYRANLPAAPAPITYQTTASQAIEDTTDNVLLNLTNLVEGRNVIAVEIHQQAPNSSDISFNLLMAGIPRIIRNNYPEVALTHPAKPTFAIAPATILLSAEASDTDGTITKVEFYEGGTKLLEFTSPPYQMNYTGAPAGTYSFTAVAIDNDGGKSVSAPITVHVYDPVSRWVAYNDHFAGPNTHPNATAWNAFETEGGAPGAEGQLRNIQTGAALGAHLSIVEVGAYGDIISGAPSAGTPAYDIFNGYVDFGSGDKNHAILVTEDSMVLHIFTGLDPLRRYSFRGTAVGGVANYSNRWTLFTISGAEAFAAAHTANVLTSGTQPALALDEAAMNTGDNRTGDVVGWDNIAPGTDGSFIILSSQWGGPAPGNAHPGPLAYAPVAIRLQEYTGVPLAEVISPLNGYTVEGPTNVALTALAYANSSVNGVQFLADGAVLGSVSGSPYTFIWNDVPFGTHSIAAVACDALGICGTSAPISLTITIPPTNLIPPTVFAKVPAASATIGYLTNVQVTFSEVVIGVDASDLLVNEVPATRVTGSGSNYVFTFAQPAYGEVNIRWIDTHGITDAGWPAHLAFYENSGGARWSYNLVDLTPPTLVSKTPGASVTVTNLTEITVTFSEPVKGINASDLLVNGTPAYGVSGSGATYTFDVSQPPSGSVLVSWAAQHGITDTAPASNRFTATVSGAMWTFTLDAKTILMNSNTMWRFVKGTNEASSPTNAWRQLAFDDSGWSNAPAPFFYGDPYSNGIPAYTHLTDMRSNYSSIYLRQQFVVPNAANITNLYVRAQIDDGMIVWINGVEVLRTNVVAGEIGYNGITINSVSGDNNGVSYINYRLLDPRSYLQSGTNVIAVHALNESLDQSSDFGFNAQLFTYQANTESMAPRLVNAAPAAGYVLALTNITVTFSEAVTNVDTADLLINGVPATGMTNPSNKVYRFSFPQPPLGAVSITWAENHGIMDLDVVPKPFDSTLPTSVWGYNLLNANAPYLAAIVPSEDTVYELSEISVTFSEPVTGVQAADLLINGVAANEVTGSGASYTFRFQQPAYGLVSVDWATNHGIQDLEVPANDFDPSWPGHRWEYSLVDQTPPVLLSQIPAAGSPVVNLTEITVNFSEPVSGVTAGDLLINGKPARSVSGTNGTYTFSFTQPNGSAIAVTWVGGHGIRDRATVPNAFDASAPNASWSYTTIDNVAPSVTLISPPPFVAVRSLSQISVTFDEPVTGVDPADLLINGGPAQQVSGSAAGPYTFVFTQPPTGQVQVAWAPAHGISDLASAPVGFAGTPWTYVLRPDLATEFAVGHVIHISVDGFGGFYMGDYITNSPALFPNLRRLVTEGASTMNARVDYTASETIPNHSSQLTGRPVEQPTGWANTTHHGITFNSDNGQTIHISGNPLVPYKSSPFDVVHDRGLSTAFLYSKQSITILARSWSSGGGPDLIGENNGNNKIDFLHSSVLSGSYGLSSVLVDDVVARIETNGLWNYTFMHWTEPDQYGHQSGWGGTAYSNQVLNLDAQLGRVMNALQANPCSGQPNGDHFDCGSRRARDRDISRNMVPVIYTLPFCMWGAGIPAGVDAYTLFSNRADPGSSRPSFSDTSMMQPLHNADVANLAVTLLGLPLIPGAPIIPVLGPKAVPLSITQSGDGAIVSWPASATGFQLQVSTSVGQNANWQPITEGITVSGDQNVFHFTPAPGEKVVFFRLRKP